MRNDEVNRDLLAVRGFGVPHGEVVVRCFRETFDGSDEGASGQIPDADGAVHVRGPEMGRRRRFFGGGGGSEGGDGSEGGRVGESEGRSGAER